MSLLKNPKIHLKIHRKQTKQLKQQLKLRQLPKKDEKKDHRHPANEAYQPRDDMHARNNQVAVEKKPLVTEIKKNTNHN